LFDTNVRNTRHAEAAPSASTHAGEAKVAEQFASWPAATRERARMQQALQDRLQVPVRAYVWGFRGIHPALLLTTSFVLSQVLHELLLYEIFVAYERHDLARTVFEIVSPLTLWLLIDTLIQIVLAVCGRGHRILAQVGDNELVVFHRRLFANLPGRIDRRLGGSLVLKPGNMGYAIDRLETSAGRFYVWGRWRDIRLLVALHEATL
jgi:hypothetical protein